MPILAQMGDGQNGLMANEGTSFFVPHWYIKAQGGAAYDVGEAKFSQLLSPSLQLAMGYKFNEYFGLRGTVSGLWAQNRYAYPETKYKWNFIQPSLDAEFDLTQLFLGADPDRLSSLYAFVGIGAAYTFNNDEAVEANEAYLTKKYYTMYSYSPTRSPSRSCGMIIAGTWWQELVSVLTTA